MLPAGKSSKLFSSFWMAGFECSDLLNRYGDRIDLLHTTRHIDKIYTDYHLLKQFNIKTVREGIRWSKVETKPYDYNFNHIKHMIDAAEHEGIQQVWDLCHFGFPDDLNPMHPHFSKRFQSLCKAFVDFYKNLNPNRQLIITPINEVGFISWLGGEEGTTSPFLKNRGWEVKYQLIGAYIKGIDELRKTDPTVRILTTEPIVNIVPPLDPTEEQIDLAREQHNHQYQALDMLSGTICPELGGKPENLDILGFNFYYNNQWVSGFEEFLPWANLVPDERWKGLSSLLSDAYNRFKKPIILSETSHSGIDRPNWIRFITEECQKAIDLDIPLLGICLYPIIDRPDWDNPEVWHHSGLWDADALQPDARVLYKPYAEALRCCQNILM